MSETTTITTSDSTTQESGAVNESQTEQSSQGSIEETGKAITTAQKEKFKLLVDGQEVEEEIDFNDKEGLRKRFQLAHAAKKRMEEANEQKRKAFNILKEFESNPESMLKRMGPKGRELAEKFLLSQIQEEMLSPEEKEFRDLKKYKESTEAEKQTAQEKIRQEAEAKREYEIAQNFQATIIEALAKSGLPKSPDLVKRFAGVMKKNLEFGLELTSDQLAQEVKSEMTALLKSIIGSAEGDQLISMFGDDVAKKIRRHDIKALQEKQSIVFQPKPQQSKSSDGPKQKSYETIDEWKERISRNLKN